MIVEEEFTPKEIEFDENTQKKVVEKTVFVMGSGMAEEELVKPVFVMGSGLES